MLFSSWKGNRGLSSRAKVKAGNARQPAEANALYLHTHYQDSGEASPTAYGGEMSKMGPSVGGLPAGLASCLAMRALDMGKGGQQRRE